MKGLASIRKFFGVFAVASVVALLVRLFVVEDYRVASGSMEPTLLTGDLVFVTKSAFNLRLPFSNYELIRLRAPRRGEVVAFTPPGQGSATYLKRVIALGGERVAIKDGKVSVGGVDIDYQPQVRALATDERFQVETWGPGSEHAIVTDPKANYGPIDVPADHFFVLGDNRSESVDGRSWGPVPYSSLKGKVSWVWMSIDPQGVIRRDRIGVTVF